MSCGKQNVIAILLTKMFIRRFQGTDDLIPGYVYSRNTECLFL